MFGSCNYSAQTAMSMVEAKAAGLGQGELQAGMSTLNSISHMLVSHNRLTRPSDGYITALRYRARAAGSKHLTDPRSCGHAGATGLVVVVRPRYQARDGRALLLCHCRDAYGKAFLGSCVQLVGFCESRAVGSGSCGRGVVLSKNGSVLANILQYGQECYCTSKLKMSNEMFSSSL